MSFGVPLHWNGEPASHEALEIHDRLAYAFASQSGASLYSSRQSVHELPSGVIVVDFTSNLAMENDGSTEIETPSQVQVAFQGNSDELFAHVLFSPSDPLELTMEDSQAMAMLCDELMNVDMDDVSKEFLRILSTIALEVSFQHASIDTNPYETRMREIFPQIFSLMYHGAQLSYMLREHQVERGEGSLLFAATNEITAIEDDPHEDLEIPPMLEVVRSDGETSWTYTRERDGSTMIHFEGDDVPIGIHSEELKALYDLKMQMGDAIPTAEDIRKSCIDLTSHLPPDHEAVLQYHMTLER